MYNTITREHLKNFLLENLLHEIFQNKNFPSYSISTCNSSLSPLPPPCSLLPSLFPSLSLLFLSPPSLPARVVLEAADQALGLPRHGRLPCPPLCHHRVVGGDVQHRRGQSSALPLRHPHPHQPQVQQLHPGGGGRGGKEGGREGGEQVYTVYIYSR